MAEFDARFNAPWWALRIGLGVVPIVAGLDKYFNLLTNWGAYLSPIVTKIIPVSVPTFMHVIGVIEIIAGIIVLTRWTRIGSFIVALWLLGIAVNLVTTGMFFDIAVRDVEIAIAAFALAQLTAVRESSLATETLKHPTNAHLVTNH